VSQVKYAREILSKFHMEGCKPLDTPLPRNWRKEDATSGEVVDAIVYQQLVGSLMYLVNMRPIDSSIHYFSRSSILFPRDRIGVKDNPFLVEREC
jgi:hypothetical protein